MTPAEELKVFLDEKKFVLSASPEFISRDDGTFSIVIRQIKVDKIEEVEVAEKTEM